MPIKLRLFGHSYCHLCDEMQRALAPWQQRFGFELEVIDISDDCELESRFGEKVPVLFQGQQEICHYFLDETALQRCLGAPAPTAISSGSDPL